MTNLIMPQGPEMEIIPPKLKNLHEILAQSRFDAPQSEEPEVESIGGGEAMKCASYRVEAQIKAEAEAICKANNSSLSAFLRGCAMNLVLEYR